MPLYRCSQNQCGISLGDAPIRTNGSYGYIPKQTNNLCIVMDYSKDFTIKIRYMPRSTATKVFCLIGTATANHYQPNPSIEIRTDNGIWGGISANGSTWTNLFDATSQYNLLEGGVIYDAIFTKTNNNYNFKIIRVSDGVTLLDTDATSDITPYQPNFQNDPICIGGIARQSRFVENDYMQYDFGHSYFKNDGVVVWGTES